jgi:hypothetical protein
MRRPCRPALFLAPHLGTYAVLSRELHLTQLSVRITFVALLLRSAAQLVHALSQRLFSPRSVHVRQGLRRVCDVRGAQLCAGVLRQCGVTSWHCACRAGALARCSSVSLTTAAVTTTPSATPFASSPQPCTVVVDSVRRQCVLHPALCYCGCRYGVYTTLIRKLVPEDGSMHMSTFFGACRLRKQQCFILACAHD